VRSGVVSQYSRPFVDHPRKTKDTYLAVSVGPSARLEKLVGKSGFPGPRSATTSYTSLLALDAA
jgi:hypothetical protein